MVMKLFSIVKTNKTKYPYKIKYKDGTKVKVPSQHEFKNEYYISKHGCSLAAFCMALRFLGKNKTMIGCLKYLKEHYSMGTHQKYNLSQVCSAINDICVDMPAKFYGTMTKAQMKKVLKSGVMLLFEERNPIHTSVVLWNGKKYIRFSDGGYKTVTLNWLKKKQCGDTWYKGCVVVRR